MARTIVLAARENGFGDVITVLHGEVEDVELPPGAGGDGKVDVIVSEWMAIFLVQEGMLESVLFARDKWLRAGGALFPCRARIYVQPCDMSEDRARELNFWNDVHGFKFGVLQQRNREAQTAGPHRKSVRADQAVAPPLLRHTASTAAPRASSSRSTLRWPACTAFISGVTQSPPTRLGSAPASSSTRAVSRWPAAAASPSGVTA